jgi:hypothetical protein
LASVTDENAGEYGMSGTETDTQVYLMKGCHSASVWRFFNEAAMLPFYRADLLNALFGDDWFSALTVGMGGAMLHCFPVSTATLARGFDAEAWLGFAGPVFTRFDAATAKILLRGYSDVCRRHGIAVETMRLNPLDDARRLINDSGLAEPLAYRNIVLVRAEHFEPEAYLRGPGRRRFQMGAGQYQVVRGNCPGDWAEFQSLLEQSLDRLGAAKRWYLTNRQRDSLRQLRIAELWLVRDPDPRRTICGAVIVASAGVAHCLYVANGDMQSCPGASELLFASIAAQLAKSAIHWLDLGGGRSADIDDSLLRFKRKFSSGKITKVPQVLMVHDAQLLDRWNSNVSDSAKPHRLDPLHTQFGDDRLHFRMTMATISQ